MKVAIIHDDLMRRGGAEQVTLSMLKAFPSADVYTLCYNPETTYPEFKNYKIIPSFYNHFIQTEKMMKLLFFPLGLLCMKFLKVKNYDLVLMSTTYCAKYARIDNHSKVFMFIHTPFRLAWNPESYQEYNNASGLKRMIFDGVVSLLKKIDAHGAKKGNHFLSITKETVERVKKAYGISTVDVIHPPVKCNNFYLSNDIGNYYLIVSRLEFYKNVHLAIEAFNKLGYRLIIVGNGSKKKELKEMAGKTVEFKSGLTKEELADLYSKCKALIFPQLEDYGITPLEANASGRPVIAYGKGGILETMIPYNGIDNRFTSVFFNEQTVDCLIDGITFFEQNISRVNSQFIRNHAEKFDESVYVNQLTNYVNERI